MIKAFRRFAVVIVSAGVQNPVTDDEASETVQKDPRLGVGARYDSSHPGVAHLLKVHCA